MEAGPGGKKKNLLTGRRGGSFTTQEIFKHEKGASKTEEDREE